MKFERSLPSVAELKIVCVAFEEGKGVAYVCAFDANGQRLCMANAVITNDHSQRLVFQPTALSYDKMFIAEPTPTPGLLEALKLNVDGAEEVLRELMPL